MFTLRQGFAATVMTATLLVGGTMAIADPGEEHGHDGIPTPAPTLPPLGSSSFTFMDAADRDGTINS